MPPKTNGHVKESHYIKRVTDNIDSGNLKLLATPEHGKHAQNINVCEVGPTTC